MNLRIVGATSRRFCDLWCSELDIRATSRTLAVSLADRTDDRCTIRSCRGPFANGRVLLWAGSNAME